MKKQRKKACMILPPVLALAVVAGSTGAEKVSATKNMPPDLEGMDIHIVQWWDDFWSREPENNYEEDLRDYRDRLQELCGFSFHFDNIGVQGEAYVEKLSSSIAAGEPIGQICALEASWVPAFINAQMMAPLDTLVEKDRYHWPVGCDFTKEKWNKGVMEATTVGGHVYGMSTEHTPGYVIFFNKRLLQEAGYGVDELYDLQRDGKWNWSKFEEVLQACTREAGSDGSGRTWGIAGDYVDYYTTALYASGADPVAKTATGRFANQIDSGKVIKTLTWADEMWEKYSVPEPAETSLDRFKKGEVAMWIGEESVREELDDLKEVLGLVIFPCPDGKELIAVEREVVMFIPSTYDEETAKKIALAYDMLTDPVPGYEEGDAWKERYYSKYADPKVVDQTLNRMRNGRSTQRLEMYVTGLQDEFENGFLRDIAVGKLHVSEAIEAHKPAWDDLIAKENAALDDHYENVGRTEAPTEAPTIVPTEEPTEALTEAPTEAGTEEKPNETLVAPTEAASDTKGNNIWPFVICGAVILLGAVAGVILKRSRSRKD